MKSTELEKETAMLAAIFVGQILFKEVSTRDTERRITEHTVTKVGNKYFECTDLRDKITISNLKHEDKVYSQHNYQMYKSKEEILEKNELIELYNSIKTAFSHYTHDQKFTLEQLRKITDVVGCRSVMVSVCPICKNHSIVTIDGVIQCKNSWCSYIRRTES